MILSHPAMLVRWLASVHLAAVLVQLTLGVVFVAGWTAPIVYHAANGWLVATVGSAQALLILVLRHARATLLMRILAVVVVLGELSQIYFGLGGGLAMHVTLGMLVWACSLAIFIRAWAPDWLLAPAGK
jgi:hypothetical protein